MSSPTFTAAELALLRFPGSVPGMLRRGSPVVGGLRGESYVCIAETGDGRWYVGALYKDGGWGADRIDDGWLCIDLTDATGRAHLAWWLADAAGYGDIERNFYARLIKAPFLNGAKGVGFYHDRGAGEWRSGCVTGHPGDIIPSLSTLDPNDPRLLPDGSRYVDAAALSLVARHVAGLEADHE